MGQGHREPGGQSLARFELLPPELTTHAIKYAPTSPNPPQHHRNTWARCLGPQPTPSCPNSLAFPLPKSAHIHLNFFHHDPPHHHNTHNRQRPLRCFLPLRPSCPSTRAASPLLQQLPQRRRRGRPRFLCPPRARAEAEVDEAEADEEEEKEEAAGAREEAAVVLPPLQTPPLPLLPPLQAATTPAPTPTKNARAAAVAAAGGGGPPPPPTVFLPPPPPPPPPPPSSVSSWWWTPSTSSA